MEIFKAKTILNLPNPDAVYLYTGYKDGSALLTHVEGDLVEDMLPRYAVSKKETKAILDANTRAHETYSEETGDWSAYTEEEWAVRIFFHMGCPTIN